MGSRGLIWLGFCGRICLVMPVLVAAPQLETVPPRAHPFHSPSSPSAHQSLTPIPPSTCLDPVHYRPQAEALREQIRSLKRRAAAENIKQRKNEAPPEVSGVAARRRAGLRWAMMWTRNLWRSAVGKRWHTGGGGTPVGFVWLCFLDLRTSVWVLRVRQEACGGLWRGLEGCGAV